MNGASRRKFLGMSSVGASVALTGCTGMSELGGTPTPEKEKVGNFDTGTGSVPLEEGITYSISGTGGGRILSGIFDPVTGADLVRHDQTSNFMTYFRVSESGNYGVAVVPQEGQFKEQAEAEIYSGIQLDDGESAPVVGSRGSLEREIESFIEETDIPGACKSSPYNWNCTKTYDKSTGSAYGRRLSQFMYFVEKAGRVEVSESTRESMESFRDFLRRLKIVDSTFHELSWNSLITDVIAGRVERKAQKQAGTDDITVGVHDLREYLYTDHYRIGEPDKTGEFEYLIDAWFDATIDLDYSPFTLDLIIAYDVPVSISSDYHPAQTRIREDEIHLSQEVTVGVR